MTSSFEIEIGLHRQDESYQVDLRFDRSDSEADAAPMRGDAKLDLFARDEFCKALRAGVLRRYGHDLPNRVDKGPIEELISAAGAVRRQLEAAEPYKVLAGLDLPVFITTNPDNLLADALTEAGKNPKVLLCRRGYDESTADAEDEFYRPTKDLPLVYHLFGHLRERDSLVLTQDDYFDYLIDVTRTHDLMPATVRRTLQNSALIFLGYQTSDWDFLSRSIMRQEGHSRRGLFSHVAVMDPEQERMVIDPDRARRYLEVYFSDAHISIFWGSADDFLRELLRQMQKISTTG
jgi:hypothetical protein